MRITPAIVLVLVVSVVAGACANDPQPEADQSIAADLSEVDGYGYHESFVAAEHFEEVALELTAAIDDAVGLPGDPHAVAARILATFDALLRGHVVATAWMGAAEVTGQQTAFLAAFEEMEAIRSALHQEFLSLFDDAIAQRFEEIWRRVQLSYVRYAEAVAAQDQDARRLAVEQLEQAHEDLLEFLVDVTGDKLEREELRHAIEDERALLLETIEEQRAGEPFWYGTLHEAVDAAVHVAELIANGLADQLQPEGDVTARAVKLRTELSGRLMETAWFLTTATRALFRDGEGEQFAAALAIVAENVGELRSTIAEVLGEDPARRFANLWATFGDRVVAYARTFTVGAAPDADRASIEEQLARIASELGELFEQATGGAISAGKVESFVEREYHLLFDAISAEARARAA